jgi:hypothetical protein
LVDGGGGADDSMVDLSEDVPEPLQEKSTTSGPDSNSEQNSRLADAFFSASARHGTEVEAVRTQASTAHVCCLYRKKLFFCFLFCC